VEKYALVFKSKYRPINREPITIDEYMVFQNHSDQSRFMLIKLRNRTSYSIRRLVIEITQYKLVNELICKASYQFDDIDVGEYKCIVPMEKIVVDESCTYIEAKLLDAETLEKTWENGIWVDKKKDQIEIPPPISFTKRIVENTRFRFPFYPTFIVIVVYILTIIAIFYALNT